MSPDTHALAAAVERGELRLHYQPAISLADGSMRGAEALVRWGHPVRGLMPPADFLPSAEAGGLISAIGAFVLEQAAHQVCRWNRLVQPPLVVSVNLSGRQLADGNVPSQVAAVLAATGVAPAHLCLEITESVLSRAGEDAACVVADLRELGVSVAVDDFGGGRAPLSLVAGLAVDAVKLDPALTAGLVEGPRSRSATSDVVAMAHELGLVVTAKGVETAAEKEALAELGCDLAQGFFLARPDEAGAVTGLLA